MKLHYYLLSMALMATASVSFTACDDDDPVDEPVYVIGGDQGDTPNIEFSQADIRVKIGEANRAALPIESATGEVKAFSLDPEVAQVVMVDGVPMVEGLKNGVAEIMVSDANNNYKKLTVSVYTTDQMQLSESAMTLQATIGTTATGTASVVLGNGEYTITSSNADVTATIDAESGEISISARTRREPYTSVLTVTDVSGLTATITVTVEATLLSDTLELSANTLNFESVLGSSASNNTIKVVKGNNGYSVKSNNPAVSANVNSQGVITITATSRIDPYTAVVTVTDAADFTATVNVTVKAIMEPFTTEQLAQIKAMTTPTVWGDCKDPSDGNTPYYYSWRDYGYGEWLNSVTDGTRSIGWWCNMYGGDYGGLRIEYPEGTAVDTEVDGKLFFQYSYIAWYSCYEYPGKVTVLVNDDTRIVAIFSQLDSANQRFNRGYVVVKK